MTKMARTERDLQRERGRIDTLYGQVHSIEDRITLVEQGLGMDFYRIALGISNDPDALALVAVWVPYTGA